MTNEHFISKRCPSKRLLHTVYTSIYARTRFGVTFASDIYSTRTVVYMICAVGAAPGGSRDWRAVGRPPGVARPPAFCAKCARCVTASISCRTRRLLRVCHTRRFDTMNSETNFQTNINLRLLVESNFYTLYLHCT